MRTVLIGALMALIVAGAAFAGGTQEAGTPEGPVTVSIWHGFIETEEATLRSVVDRFNAENEDVTVELLAVPFDELQNKFQTEAASGGGPTLVIGPQDRMASYNQAALLREIDEDLSLFDDLVPAAVEGGRVGGTLVGIPVSNKVVALVYNRAIVGSEPANFDELAASVAEHGMAVTADWFHNYMWGPAFGATFLDENNKVVIDEPEGVEAYSFFYEMAHSDGVIFDGNDGDMDTIFRQGEVGYRIQGPWASGDYINDLGAENVGVMAFPAVPGGTYPRPWNQSEMVSVNVNATDAEYEAAMDFMEAFTSAEIQKEFLDAANWIPANADVDTSSNPVVGGFLRQVEYSDPFPVVSELNATWEPMGNAITQILEGVAGPEDALSEAAELINRANNKD